MVGLQRIERGLEQGEGLVAMLFLAKGLLTVEAEDTAAPALAGPEDDFFGTQVGRDLGGAAGVDGTSFLISPWDPQNSHGHPADRRCEDVVAGAVGQFLEGGFGGEAYIADEERASETPVTEVVLDLSDLGDLPGIAGRDPEAQQNAIDRRQAIDPIRVPSMFYSLEVRVLYPA